MADTYTTNLRLRKPEIGANDDVWAPLLNVGLIKLYEDALAAESVIDVTSGNVTLTQNDGAADQARAMFLRITGTPGTTRLLNSPSASKVYVVKNDSDSTVTVKPTTGTGVDVLAGSITMVYIEAGVAAYEVLTEGTYVQQPTGLLTTLTLDILTSGGGDTTVTARYGIQGSMVYFQMDEFDATSCTGTVFSVLDDSGDWPSDMVPETGFAIPIHMLEDTGGGDADRPCVMQISASTAAAWNIDFASGGPWTTGSDRQLVRPISFTYSLRGIS